MTEPCDDVHPAQVNTMIDPWLDRTNRCAGSKSGATGDAIRNGGILPIHIIGLDEEVGDPGFTYLAGVDPGGNPGGRAKHNWVESRLRAAKSRLALTAAVVALGVFGAMTTGCSKGSVSWDESFAITIHNDTAAQVAIKSPCVTCKRPTTDTVGSLQPGRSLQVTFSNSSSWTYQVADGRGRQLGCLPFLFSAPPKTGRRTADVSSMQHCPGRWTTPLR